MRGAGMIAALALLAAAPASAQQLELETAEPPFNPWMFNVGGGLSFPVGEFADAIETGGAFQIGGGWRFMPELGVQLTYFYSGYDVEEDVLPGGDLDAYASIQYGALEAVYTPIGHGPVDFYLVGGPGLYYRYVTVSRFAGTAVVPYCDPWLFYCSATAVEARDVIGSRDDWNFGVGGGLGVMLKLGPYAGVFLEGRYHYVWGDEFTDAEGNERDSDAQFIPVMAGFRF